MIRSITRYYIIFCVLILKSYLLFSQVVINEILAYNASINYDTLNYEFADWIEIKNASSSSASIYGIYITDDLQNPYKWRIEVTKILLPGECQVIWMDELNEGFHTNFNLEGRGETLALFAYNQILDSVTYATQFPDVSYGRNPDDPNTWNYFDEPTPGYDNTTPLLSTSQPSDPVFSKEGGIYSSAIWIELSASDTSCEIRYTLDGSIPVRTSDLYESPIVIWGNQVMKARTFKDGYLPGNIVTHSYLSPDHNHELPIVSISTDPVNLWDDLIGIYTEGTNGVIKYCSEEPMNYNQHWERAGWIEFFDTEGKKQLSQGLGLKIHGGCSRGAPRKSFGLFARDKYGNNRIHYQFFDDKQVSEFKSLILRNSGNDWAYTLFRDAFMQELTGPEMNIDYQAYQPCVVYLNGQYWGLYNIREKANQYFVTSNYDLTTDEFHMVYAWGQLEAGDWAEFQMLEDFLANNSMESDARYNQLKGMVDIENYIDYQIAETFIANTDWPMNNNKKWKTRYPGSLWRWILMDTDFGFGLYDKPIEFNMLEFAAAEDGEDWPNPPWSTLMFRRCLENKEFRDLFVQRYIGHLNTTFQESRILGLIDRYSQTIESEMPYHITRWETPWGGYNGWMNQLEVMRNFGRQRSDFVFQHLRDFFGLGSINEISIQCDSIGGILFFNGLPVPESGVLGKFFSYTPVELTAVPRPGYRFSSWEIDHFSFIHDVLIEPGSEWNFWDKANHPGLDWFKYTYLDSHWDKGYAELGYGDGNENTEISYGNDPGNKIIAYYFRKSFQVDDPNAYEKIRIRLMRDDGAVVYLNGHEIIRSNMPDGSINENTVAIEFVGGGDESTFFEFETGAEYLITGKNILAVEIHQISGESSDISFDLSLEAGSEGYLNHESFGDWYINERFNTSLAISAVFEQDTTMPQLFINEIMASNIDFMQDELGNYPDWVEIYNPGPYPVDIGGFYITDDLSDPTKWLIPVNDPEQTVIYPGDFLLLFADNDTTKGSLHLGFRLDRTGEAIGLFLNNGTNLVEIDSKAFPEQITDYSFGRYTDGAENWYAMENATPGGPNNYTLYYLQSNQPQELRIYPNPARDVLYVDLGGLSTEMYDRDIVMQILNSYGQVMQSSRIQSSGNIVNLNVSDLKPGMYIIRVMSEQDSLLGRFIVF